MMATSGHGCAITPVMTTSCSVDNVCITALISALCCLLVGWLAGLFDCLFTVCFIRNPLVFCWSSGDDLMPFLTTLNSLKQEALDYRTILERIIRAILRLGMVML